MAIISRSDADVLRNNYKNTNLDDQKNIEAALFSKDEVQLLINQLPQDATHLKVFLVWNNGFIDMCMTGSRDGTTPMGQMENGKIEIDANLAGNDNPELLLSVLPCPPHCGQGNNGNSVAGLDSKYVSG